MAGQYLFAQRAARTWQASQKDHLATLVGSTRRQPSLRQAAQRCRVAGKVNRVPGLSRADFGIGTLECRQCPRQIARVFLCLAECEIQQLSVGSRQMRTEGRLPQLMALRIRQNHRLQIDQREPGLR